MDNDNKSQLLTLTQELIDVKKEKKEFNKEVNGRIKRITEDIEGLVREG